MLSIQFPELDKTMTLVEGELLLREMISDWSKLAKRFFLSGQDDETTIQRCQFYAGRLIKKFPALERFYLKDYYDEAIAEFAGMPYVIRRDKAAQEKMGFKSIIFNGQGLYLFPLNHDEEVYHG